MRLKPRAGRRPGLVLCALLFALLWPGARPTGASPASGRQYNTLWRQSTVDDFRAWGNDGVTVAGEPSGAAVHLAPRATEQTSCRAQDIDGGRAGYSADAGLCAGRDPVVAGGYGHGLSYYNGGSFYYGTVVSPMHRTARPIDHLIASWDAETPAGTWIEVRVRVQEGEAWSRWYILGIWASGTRAVHRHSVDGQSDRDGGVDTDTLRTVSGREASAYQVQVTLFTASVGRSPVLRSVAVIASHDGGPSPAAGRDRIAWGLNLPVPPRSQMLARYRGLGYGGGGEVWCSPTSASMVMDYWAAVLHRRRMNRTVPQAARGTYDWTYGGTGNWPFNTAYAAEFGLATFVTRMSSMTEIEHWIRDRVPIVISIAFRRGELPGEPLGASAGHLLVVRGFTGDGDVITNDPGAATDAAARIVYPRAALEHVWQAASQGTAYVLYPPGWTTPAGS